LREIFEIISALWKMFHEDRPTFLDVIIIIVLIIIIVIINNDHYGSFIVNKRTDTACPPARRSGQVFVTKLSFLSSPKRPHGFQHAT